MTTYEKAIAEKDARIAELEAENEALKSRLHNVLHMDSIERNQDIVTLKSDIASKLKMDYADFIEMKKRKYNPGLHAVCCAILGNIFKCLKSKGVDCENGIGYRREFNKSWERAHADWLADNEKKAAS